MVIELLFYIVSAVFLLMLAIVVFLRSYYSRVYYLFYIFFSLLLLLLLLFVWWKPGSDFISLKLTNYSSEKGNLYLYSEDGCDAPVKYDFPISNNEEKIIEMKRVENQIRQVILVTTTEKVYSIPVPGAGSNELNIWEKEMKPAGNCYLANIEAYQLRQKMFSVTIGLSLFSILFLFGYRWKRKQDSVITGS